MKRQMVLEYLNERMNEQIRKQSGSNECMALVNSEGWSSKYAGDGIKGTVKETELEVNKYSYGG